MSTFDRTVRALQSDGTSPAVLGVITITILIAIWCCWILFGRVSVYEVSAAGRLEAERIFPVAASVAGRIAASHLALGRRVRRGDVLIEIDADRERLETSEERTRLTALRSQIAAIAREIAAEEEALEQVDSAARVTLSEASQKLISATAALRAAEDHERRVRLLGEQGLVSQIDIVRAGADAEGRRADAEGARLAIERLRAQQMATEREQRSHLGAIVRERLTLEGELATVGAAVTRREQEADERRITAPVDGLIGEMAPLTVGAVIQEGDRIASIVPDDDIQAVAEFLPAAMGRVRPGQPARLRLDGFSWTQYGHIPARVRSVASEPRDGRIRVEFDLQHSPASLMPLQHGLPGAVEVEVDRVAPAALLLRTLGYALARADARPDVATTPERVTQ